MCIRFGRQCPGPGKGPIIISMSGKTKPEARKPKTKEDSPGLFFCSLPPETLWGMTIPISQRNAVTEVFYGKFLAYFTSTGESADIQNRVTWLHRLPDLSTDGTNNALTLALHATSSAFAFVKTNNISLLQDAYNLYGKALHMHSHLIRSKKEITVHMVSTSVLLSIFEAMNATTASAYRQHISGAAEMVKLAGPQQCVYGVMCQLFMHIRTQMVLVYLTTRQEDQNTVCAEKMLRESLNYKRLPVFQRLMGHITRLAGIYVALEDGEDREQKQVLDLEVYMEVKSQVDELWLEYEEAAEQKGEVLSWTTEQGSTEYRDAFTALSIAYFASARILFRILAPRLAVSYLDFTDYYGVVLDVARYLSAFKIGCGFMRMANPLYLVALHAPQSEQRKAAIRIFEGWKRLGMSGISKLALERIYSDQARRNEETSRETEERAEGLDSITHTTDSVYRTI